MNRTEFIFEMIVTLALGGLFIWAFASGPNTSWGWHVVIAAAEYLQMQGA